MATTQEVVEDFTNSLDDLKFNSKPFINMLTMLADDNIVHAQAIVQAVEKHLHKVSSNIKLPVLYLIDSIVKNVAKDYLPLFTQNIVSTFCSVFEKVDEPTRAQMWKLRTTWSDVFPPKKMYAIDVRVHEIDPAWPIVALAPTSIIHVNPKFLNRAQDGVSEEKQKPSPVPPIMDINDVGVRAKVLQKQKELLDLQQQRLKLELFSIEQEEKKLQQSKDTKIPLPTVKVQSKVELPVSQPFNQKVARMAGKLDLKPNSVAVSETRRDPRLSRVISSKESSTAPPPPLSQGFAGNLTVNLTSGSNKDVRNNKDSGLSTDFRSVGNKSSSILASNHSLEVPSSHDHLQKNKGSGRSKSNSNQIGLPPPALKSKSDSPKVKSSTKRGKSPVRATSKSSLSTGSRRDKDSGESTPSPAKSKKLQDKSGKRSSSSSSSAAATPSPSGSSSGKSKRERRGAKRDSPASDHDAPVVKHQGPPSGIRPLFKDVKNTRNRSYKRPKHDASESPERRDVDFRKLSTVAGGSSSEVGDGGIVIIDDVLSQSDTSGQNSPRKRKNDEEKDEVPASKKSKAELFDDLFGSEDVDLRPPIPSDFSPRPPLSPGSSPAHGWAKYKESNPELPSPVVPMDVDADIHEGHGIHGVWRHNRPTFDRLGRPLLYNRLPDNPEERRRSLSTRASIEDERAEDERMLHGWDLEEKTPKNISLILGQAEQAMKNGSMSINQYNTLLKQVIQINEMQKIRELQRRERHENKENWDERPGQPPHSEWESRESDVDRRPDDADVRHQPYPVHGDIDERTRGAYPHRIDSGPVVRPPVWENPPRPWREPQSFPPQGGFRSRWPWRDGYRRPHYPAMWGEGDRFPGGREHGRHRAHDQDRYERNRNYPSHGRGEQGASFDGSAEVEEGEEELPAVLPATLAEVLSDTTKSINIDDIARDIRYYNDSAILMLNWDDPRDLSFEPSVRRVTFDDRDHVDCRIGQDYYEFTLTGSSTVHRIKLGAPTRELYINGRFYECYFGGVPIQIELEGRTHYVRLEGPPPQVKIGKERRTDLVVGKINLIVNAKEMFGIYLDAKPQHFDIGGKPHIFKFADSLKTVLINGVPHAVDFGGLPMPVVVGRRKHFVRFTALPRNVRQGHVIIKNMARTTAEEHPQIDEPGKDDGNGGGHQPVMPMIGSVFGDGVQKREPGGRNRKIQRPKQSRLPHGNESPSQSEVGGVSPNSDSQGSMPMPNQLELLTSLMTPGPEACTLGTNYRLQQETAPASQTSVADALPSTSSATAALAANMDISELYQKLLAIGLLPSKDTVEAVKKEEEIKNIKEVDFTQESLQMRQAGVINLLYSGIQCSSCGMRFAPEQTMKYSQHLDWHFRQNRRERDCAKKAQSRKWHYDVSDWIQFEEIEDLEERAQSWFETQDADKAEEEKDAAAVQSVKAAEGVDPDAETCAVCHEGFELFYHHETEEWHLRDAMRVDGKTYHPVCFEDLKNASADSTLNEEDDAEEMADASKEGEEDVKQDVEMEVKQEEELKEKQEAEEEAEKEEEAVHVKTEPMETDSEVNHTPAEIAQDPADTQSDELPAAKEEIPTDIPIKQEPTEQAQTDEETSAEKDAPEEEEEDQTFQVDVLPPETKSEAVPVHDLEGVGAPPPLAPDAVLAATTVTAPATEDDSTPASAAPPSAPKIKINLSVATATTATVDEAPEPAEEEPSSSQEMDEDAPTPAPTSELSRNAKPRTTGRRFTEYPPLAKGTEMSGLCSIM